MILGDSYCFLHLQKCAGTNISATLTEHFGGVRQRGKQHHPVLDRDPNCLYFGSIRNPYSYYVSVWAFRIGRINSDARLHRWARTMMPDRMDLMTNPLSVESFREWLKILLRKDRRQLRGGIIDYLRDDHDIGWFTYRYFTILQNKQFEFLSDPHGDDLLDDIVRVEHLNEDLSRVLRRIGFDDPAPLVAESRERQPRNRSRHLPYEQYYDDELIALVAEKDGYLLEKYDYSFPANGARRHTAASTTPRPAPRAASWSPSARDIAVADANNMNRDEGHLGGYVRSSPKPAPSGICVENGAPGTWSPKLWRWACDELRIRSVLDVGCGEAHSAAFFRSLGCEVLAVDGSTQAKRDSRVPDSHVLHDFTQGPYAPDRDFDLVWSCEFVEHVEPQFVSNFLAAFGRASKFLMMTYAHPGQEGWHHVNCRPASYWISKVEALGFAYDEEITKRAKAAAEPGHFRGKGLVFRRVAAD